jgi:hypothetical protein
LVTSKFNIIKNEKNLSSNKEVGSDDNDEQTLQFVSFFNNSNDSVDIYSIMRESQTRVYYFCCQDPNVLGEFVIFECESCGIHIAKIGAAMKSQSL